MAITNPARIIGADKRTDVAVVKIEATGLPAVKIGDVVTARVEVAELVPERRRARLFCECLVDGKAVLEGEAWVALPRAAQG